MKAKKQAVSPILSTIFILTITLMVTSSLLIWGVPTVQKLQYESQYLSTKNYFDIIDNAMDEVVREGNGSARTVSVLINNGFFTTEKFTERWIIYYDLIADQNITYSGFDDNDKNFTIYTNISRINITIQWINENGVNATFQRNNVQPINGTYEFKDTYGTVPYNLNGIDENGNLRIVKIGVHNATSGIRFSELWLFDIGSIKYSLSSPIGFYSLKEINNGVVEEIPGGTIVEDLPYFIERRGKTITLGMIQLNTSGGGSGSLKVKMKNEYSEIIKNSIVYNLRMEIFSTEKDAFVYSWYNLFSENHQTKGFFKEGGRLLYKAEHNKVELKLLHTIIKVEVK